MCFLFLFLVVLSQSYKPREINPRKYKFSVEALLCLRTRVFTVAQSAIDYQ